MGGAARRGRLMELLGPVVSRAGFDLEDVTVSAAGKHRRLSVVVDRDAGVTVEDTGELARMASAALDDSDAMGQASYVLEVTSPGTNRPLTEPRHWHRAAGRLVRVQLADGGEIAGRVVSADSSDVVLDVDGANRKFGYGELRRGKVQVELRRSAAEEH